LGSNSINATTISGTSLYGAIEGSNTINASTVSGASLFGAILGSNAINASTVSGTSLFGAIVGSNTISGTTITGTAFVGTLYGPVAGSNTISASTINTSGNVGVSNNNATKTLSIGSNTYVDDTGTNTIVTQGNVVADYFSGNAYKLVSLTGASASTYGNNLYLPQISVDVSGRITGIQNTQIQMRLSDVVNFGNSTSNTL
jgi:hypothetical protein